MVLSGPAFTCLVLQPNRRSMACISVVAISLPTLPKIMRHRRGRAKPRFLGICTITSPTQFNVRPNVVNALQVKPPKPATLFR